MDRRAPDHPPVPSEVTHGSELDRQVASCGLDGRRHLGRAGRAVGVGAVLAPATAGHRRLPDGCPASLRWPAVPRILARPATSPLHLSTIRRPGVHSAEGTADDRAQVVWGLVNVVALLFLVWLSVHAARPGLDGQRLLGWSLILMTPAFFIEPVHLTFAFGQVNIVLAGLILADLTCSLRWVGELAPRGVARSCGGGQTHSVGVRSLSVGHPPETGGVGGPGYLSGCSVATAATGPGVSWSYWTKYATDA